MKKKLTLGRRVRIAEILSGLGDGVSIDVKARKVAQCLGEPCTHGQALSLLSQFRKRKRSKTPAKSSAEINQERFERQKARRPDLYR